MDLSRIKNSDAWLDLKSLMMKKLSDEIGKPLDGNNLEMVAIDALAREKLRKVMTDIIRSVEKAEKKQKIGSKNFK